MKSINKVILVGNLGKDPEVKYLANGTPVAKLVLATSESYKDKSGEWQELTKWHTIIAWRKLAELASQYLKKGSRVYVEGSLETRSWEDKRTREKKYATEVVASELVFMDGRPAGRPGPNGASNERTGAARSRGSQAPAAVAAGGDENSEFPF